MAPPKGNSKNSNGKTLYRRRETMYYSLPMRIIDVHTHAFPDKVAENAIPRLEKEGNIKAKLDGTLSGLLRSMDEAGIEKSVVASIATKPEQFTNIAEWSAGIASEKIVPFPSVHPDDPKAEEHLEELSKRGFRGVKLHPYYQKFIINEERMVPLYEKIAELGLALLLHTGFDIAFPKDRIADPEKIVDIITKVPELKLITSHFGGWEDWEMVERHLIGKPVYMDISYSIGYLQETKAKQFLEAHPRDRILFGTDSPWGDQTSLIAVIKEMGLERDQQESLFCKNAERLLRL